jgi:outer membrane protein OmpA-like peptidoglycan-associated protein
MNNLRSKTMTLGLALAVPLTMGACGLSTTQKGAVIGAAGGAAAGAAVGTATGSTARGAIIGAAVGGTGGAIIGSQMDKQRAELAAQLEGAKVERVGEGLLVTFDSGLLFDFDSDVVKGAARENLTELARSLRENPNSDLLIVGHTDAQGSDAYNQGLSQRRASAAARYMTTQGLASDRVRTTGLGESEPVQTNDSDWGRAQNRRVEVAIFASKEYRDRLIKMNGGG